MGIRKIGLILSVLAVILPLQLPSPALALSASDCQAKIGFDVNPKTITSLEQTLTISGWVQNTSSVANLGYCVGPATSIREFTVNVYNSNPTILAASFTVQLSGGAGQLTLPSKNFSLTGIGISVGTLAANTADIYAEVVAKDTSNGLETILTRSSPVTVTVNSSQTNSLPSVSITGNMTVGQPVVVEAVNFNSSKSLTVQAVIVKTGKTQSSATLNASNNWRTTFTFDSEGDVQLLFTSSDPNYLSETKTITISKNAASTSIGSTSSGSTSIDSTTGQVNYDCTQANPDPRYCIINPLPADNLTDMVLLIMRGFIMVVAIWSVLFIIVGGFRMVIANGNEEALGVARKTITWAVLGLIIAMLSFSIVAIVQNVLGVKVPGINVTSPQSATGK